MQAPQAKTAIDNDEREICAGAGMILHAAQFGQFPHEYFDPDYWLAASSAHRLGAGRGASWLINSHAGDWVLRHYRRGGAVARISDDRYLWSGHARSRSIVEWRLLASMHRRGLPVPKPIGARVMRRGLTYTADLITGYLPHTRTLGERLASGDVDASAMRATGRCIRRFHDEGIWHADLNAHNVLLDAENNTWLIDFDRARVRRAGRWPAANLKRLRRSLDKLAVQGGAHRFDDSLWDALQGAYGRAPQ